MLLRELGDISLHPQGRPCGPPPTAAVLAPAATRRSRRTGLTLPWWCSNLPAAGIYWCWNTAGSSIASPTPRALVLQPHLFDRRPGRGGRPPWRAAAVWSV